MHNTKLLSRRAFLKVSAASVAVGASLFTVPAQAIPFYDSSIRKLAFHNTHTNERVSATFWKNGHYDLNVLKQFNLVLRDFRTGDVARMDPKLFDLLHKVQARLGNHDTLQIISGYRSPVSNRWLASHGGGGVAKNSYHMKAQAIDIRIDGVNTGYIQRAALSLQSGGVGYYRDSDFVHVDTGPVRAW